MASRSAKVGIAAATSVLALIGGCAGLKSANSQHDYGLPVIVATDSGLPACVVEDGNGMALCWWDAQRQGNGHGTSVVSGDCAPDVMRGAWALCVRLYTVPDGAALDHECAAVKKSGSWTVAQCMDVWHKLHG